MAATRSTASRANSGLCTMTFGISQLGSPRKWEMAGVFDGQRADPVRRQQSPVLILLLHGMAGLPPFISFSTNYPESNPVVIRHTDITSGLSAS